MTTTSPELSHNVIVINGSLGGAHGNTGAALEHWLKALSIRANVTSFHLAQKSPSVGELLPHLQQADAFIFATGTYWDSWGSPLQRFFEETTRLEGGDVWLGKPAAVLVSMHSVGGKEVLSRLQGVLSTLGLLIPPMSGMVLSLANQLAAQSASDFADDFWQLADLEVMTHNLLEATAIRKGAVPQWKAWNVDRADPSRRWLPKL